MKNDAQDKNTMFSETIGKKEKLKIKAEHNKPTVWNNFGLFGMVGWSVVVPTLLGVAAGYWADKHFPQHFSWTLSGLFTGLILGSIIAWQWVEKEKNEINKNTEDNNE